MEQLRIGAPPTRPRREALRPEAPEWHPLRDSANTASHVKKILEAYRLVAARQHVAPGWRPFWGLVMAICEEEADSQELQGILRAGGFYGPTTVTAPSASLESQLEHLAQAGAAQGGLGLSRSGPSLGDLPPVDTRWQSRLKPDLRRAAPEIYLNSGPKA